MGTCRVEPLLSKACEAVAALYNLIEEGAPWPQGTECAKADFLEKEGAPKGEVMSYRILLIMAALYRKWATIRLGSMDEWIGLWALKEMYAGTGGQGAEDAWYQTMADIEALNVAGDHYCGAAADIMKFFDQIIRELVYALAAVAGMPKRVLEPYKRFQEALMVYNSLANSTRA